MKVICLILSLYIFSSSVYCCSDADCDNEIKTEQASDHDEHDDSGSCNTCSPFLVCGSCTGFIFSNIFLVLQPFVVNIEKLTTPLIPEISQNYFAEIWQPPKVS